MAASRRWPKNWFAGILYVRFVIPLEAADVAKLAAEAAEAAVSAKVRGSKRRRSGDLAPYDISNELCWADQSKETCCQGDATSHAECWDESYSFEECCPNADCWDGKLFTYEACCDQKHGENGNPGCWSGYYDYEHCCLANRSSQSWVDIILREIDTDQFYGMDEFYTDSQYGNDFGYYSTGRVLGKSDGKTAQEFAHYTTYPMALSPHFGRVLCRLVFIMWIQMKEKAPFRVVEMGAGSGQLAHDIHVCVKRNELGIEPAVWRRFVGAFEYVIVERSPALARRQRERGLKVVNGDAQRKDSCPSVLRALASSDACSAAFSSAPECQVSDRADKHTAASVVLSNELLDAFAPVKLQLSIYGQPVVTHCRAWQEIRMVHIIKLKDLESISQALHHSEERISAMAMDLEGYTNEVFCRVTNTSVGQAAMACAPTSSCLAMVIVLSEIMNHHDLHLPAAAHNMRLRLRKDAELCQRLQGMVSELEENFQNSVVLPRQVYRMLRHQLREAVELELLFLTSATTRQVPVPLSERRCEDLKWWFEVHEARIQRLIDIYRPLGYPNIQLLLRPGERNFVELVDCLIGKEGFMLAVDYGATFEELQHVSTRLTQATIYMIMVAAALSTAVARATAGNYQLFQPTWAEDILQSIEGGSVDKILGKKMWMLIAIPIAVACSLCGFVISKSTSVLHRLVQKYRPLAPLPVAFALQALITASFGALVFRTTGLQGVWGIGAESLQIAMTKTVPLGHLLLFAIGKGLALILGMAVRCPADMLEPVLITGGFLGGAIGSLLPQDDTELLQGGTVMPCIIFGMVGLFASCFRFSLTPIVIVLEIVGTESYSLILPAVLCGFTASTCSDHLFPALLEDILEQDGINLQELAEQAEETFEADDAAREREESEEESVETNGRSMNRHGTSKSHKSRHSGSAPSEGSDRAMSRQNSEAPLSFLRRGLEESLYQQSTAKTKSRTITIRDGANLLSRSNSHRYHPQSQRHSLPELTSESLCRGGLAESGGKIEIPLQGLRNPVDLRFQVHEVVDGDGHHKYFLQVSNSQSPTRGPYRAHSGALSAEVQLQGLRACRMPQSEPSVGERGATTATR